MRIGAGGGRERSKQKQEETADKGTEVEVTERLPCRAFHAKLERAADSESKVGMASTRRVTVRESRTRPWPQTRCRAPASRARRMEMRTSVEMPELSICGT